MIGTSPLIVIRNFGHLSAIDSVSRVTKRIKKSPNKKMTIAQKIFAKEIVNAGRVSWIDSVIFPTACSALDEVGAIVVSTRIFGVAMESASVWE